MNVTKMADRYEDPILTIAKDILVERRHQDVNANEFASEIWRRYIVGRPDLAADIHLPKYACNGGFGGLARRLLKRPIAIDVGAHKLLRVPERLHINDVYRPTLICTVAELDQNTRSKRRAISYDVRAVRPLERLADLMKDAGTRTVGEQFGEAEEVEDDEGE